jgi:hypothetical protein
MGIADIQRGQTDPSETLGAQIIKSNNASGRLKTMQHDVVDFATKLLQLKAEIICKHFQEQTILEISGASQLSEADQRLIPQALELLKQNPAKNFRIEVTTDSMIFQDEQQEKQDRVEFLTAVSSFIQTALPVAQGAPELTPLLMEMLKFGVTAFKAGKQMEGLIDETADKFREQAKAMEGQPKAPPPEVQKAQAESQAKMQEIQAKGQMELQLKQADVEVEKMKQEFQSQETQLRMQMEQQRDQAEFEMQSRIKEHEIELQTQKDILKTYLDNATKIETARISAGLDSGDLAYADAVQQAAIIQDQMGYSDMKNHPLQPAIDNMQMTNQQMTQMLGMLMEKLNQPKTVLRDQNGKIVGVN